MHDRSMFSSSQFTDLDRDLEAQLSEMDLGASMMGDEEAKFGMTVRTQQSSYTEQCAGLLPYPKDASPSPSDTFDRLEESILREFAPNQSTSEQPTEAQSDLIEEFYDKQ